MKIYTLFDDSAARLPLAIRSAEGVWDRAADLRTSPGVLLVELTTQHMLNTGITLTDELAHYFDEGSPSESDPYALGSCYANRKPLEDLLHDLRDIQQDLIVFQEIEALFPASFRRELHFTLALTVVGYPAFGYVRTYKDSEEEEYHGMVINLAQARPHLEQHLGQFSRSLLIDAIRYGFFNHEGFQIAYAEYCEATRRQPERPLDRLKEAMFSRGTAWYLSYRHDLAFYDAVMGPDQAVFEQCVHDWNKLVEATRKKHLSEDTIEDWLRRRTSQQPEELCVDVVGYYVVRAVAAQHGDAGLQESIQRGPDHLIALYNALGQQTLKS
jgi:hypothetical protein